MTRPTIERVEESIDVFAWLYNEREDGGLHLLPSMYAMDAHHYDRKEAAAICASMVFLHEHEPIGPVTLEKIVPIIDACDAPTAAILRLAEDLLNETNRQFREKTNFN